MRTSRARRGGFTLLELLVVIAIIGILAAFLAVFIGGLTKKAKIEKTRALLNRLSTGLQSYKEQFLNYPPSTPAPVTPGARAVHYYTCAVLSKLTQIDPVTRQGIQTEVGPFVQNLNNSETRNGVAFPSGWSQRGGPPGSADTIIDTWGQAIGYYCTQQGPNQYGGINHTSQSDWLDNRSSFDLWSMGPWRSSAGDAQTVPSPSLGQRDGNHDEVISNWIPSR